MFNLKSLVTKGVLTAMAVVSIGSASIRIVKANNWEDRWFSFNFESYSYAETEALEKEDTSASYMNCISGDGEANYYATIYGCNDTSKSGRESCSNTYSYTEGTVRYHSNLVKEHGHNYAYFLVESNYENVGFSGYWSPDNYNKYQ
ncbi:MAG: DUF2712 domain-containing protein [Lachnospira sp.]